MPFALLMVAAVLIPASASAHDGRGGAGGGFPGGNFGAGFAVPRFSSPGFITPGFSGGFTTPGFSSSPAGRRLDRNFDAHRRHPNRFLHRRFADPDTVILDREGGFSERRQR
jgi:hypothetical protein